MPLKAIPCQARSRTQCHWHRLGQLHVVKVKLRRIDLPATLCRECTAAKELLAEEDQQHSDVGISLLNFMLSNYLILDLFATLRREYAAAKELLAEEDPEHSAVGIGLLNFMLSKERLDAAISCQPDAIWLSFSDHLGDWDAFAAEIKEAGIKLICQARHNLLGTMPLLPPPLCSQLEEKGLHAQGHAESHLH
jgi:hypothetical protein